MAFVLLVPFFVIRFGLLAALDKEAVGRAARFAPLEGNEKIAYVVYQLANLAILAMLLFSSISFAPPLLFWTGAAVYAFGFVLLVASVIDFASPSQDGLNQRGVYRYSRNPMYVAYFVYFAGCALLTHSLVLMALVVVFQLAGHWIVLSEERWCLERFGDAYRSYMERVRRYV